MKNFMKTMGVILLIMVSLFFVFRLELVRLYKVITLFEDEKMAMNFMNLDQIFPTSAMEASENPSSFIESKRSFQLALELNGQKMNFDQFLEYSHTNGLLILQNNTILYESYFNGFDESQNHISWSMCKSIISALIGIANQEGLIESIMDPIEKYVPELKGSSYENVSIKDVLHMSSGVKFNEDYQDFNSDINKMGRVFALGRSLDNYVKSLDKERKAGEYHNYVSMDTQVLGMILTRVTGSTIAEYCETKLWHPMGAEANAFWIKDKKGMEAAFGGLNAVMRDYARFGQLYANKGRSLEGRQIVPEDWVINSWKTDEPQLIPGDNPLSSSIFGYGYQWWIPYKETSDVMAIGIYNQYIFIHPESKLVIVKLSANPDFKVDKHKTHQEHLEFFNQIKNQVSL